MAEAPVERDLPWLPRPHEARIHPTTEAPPRQLVTAAFMLALDREQLLMTCLRRRGWDLAGGHLEPGESAEAAARRELWEEAAVTAGRARQIGVQHIRLLGPAPTNYPYPHPESYQVFYVASLQQLHPFAADAEAVDRALFPRDDAEHMLSAGQLILYHQARRHLE